MSRRNVEKNATKKKRKLQEHTAWRQDKQCRKADLDKSETESVNSITVKIDLIQFGYRSA